MPPAMVAHLADTAVFPVEPDPGAAAGFAPADALWLGAFPGVLGVALLLRTVRRFFTYWHGVLLGLSRME